MRRHDMLIKRIREVRASGMYDDPGVIAYEPAPSWIAAAVAEGWAAEERAPGFKVWRLTEIGKQAIDDIRPVGRPPITLAQREAREKQKHTDTAVTTLRKGVALYGISWLKMVLTSVTPEVK